VKADGGYAAQQRTLLGAASVNVCLRTMHFPAAAYCCTVNRFNPSLWPWVSSPQTAELTVLPSPSAGVCLLSRFCPPRPRHAVGCREAWGPGTLGGTGRGLGGLVGIRGPSVAKRRAAVPVVAQPERLPPRPRHLSHLCLASRALGQWSGASSCSLARHWEGCGNTGTGCEEAAMANSQPW